MELKIDPDNIPDYVDFQKVLDSSNISQKECALLLKISERTVSRWYTGENEIPYSSWKLLLYELGLIDDQTNKIKLISDEIKNMFDSFFEIKKEFQRIIQDDPSSNPESFVMYDIENDIYIYKVVFYQNSMRAMIRGVDGKIFTKDIKTGIDFLQKMLKEQRVISYLPDAVLIACDGDVSRMERHY